jgi:hypothetical protein
MRIKLGRVAAIAAVAAVTGVGFTQVAEAAPVGLTYAGIQTQVDNDPGNGAASWAWAYSSSSVGGVEVEYYDGHTLKLNATKTGASKSLGASVWRFRVFNIEPTGGTTFYSNWKNT